MTPPQDAASTAQPGPPSLPEVHRSVVVPNAGGFLRKLFAFMGPGYLVAVGYMDPGNWATSIAGGAQFGYALLAVALMSNIMAIILQGKINESQCLDATYASCAFSGYALFWTGVSVGFSNLFCGYPFPYQESAWEFQVAAVRSPTRRTLTPLSRS